MDKLILKDLILRSWKYIVIVILAIAVYILFNKTKQLETKIEKSIEKAKEHEIKAQFYKDIYDMQMSKDSALNAKYDSIKNIKYEKINNYTISDMQSYFDKRTKNSRYIK